MPAPTKAHPLAVVGTVAIDSLETPHGSREQAFGGSASYFSYAASFFTPVSLVAAIGEDFPQDYRKVLEEKAIDLSHLEVAGAKTFFWKGKYEGDMNVAQTLETRLNVLQTFNPELHFSEPPEYLFLANVDPEIQLRVLKQLPKPKLKFVACDTMNFWIETKKEALLELLKHVDCIVLNDAETRQLTGEQNLIRGAQKIREWGPGQVVIKKGEHGSLVFHEKQFFALPAYPLESVFDPTGAGDSFAGGFMGWLASTGDLGFENMKRAVAMGSVVASFTVEDFSLDRLRRLERGELDARFEAFRKISSF